MKFKNKKKQPSLTSLTKEQYQELFSYNQPSIVIGKKKLEIAYEKAWESRKFEIDNYWKRATYFWAFQVASFTAYIAILNSSSYNKIPSESPEVLYCIACIGFITALAWCLINKGSKFWQRHWEKHIDMLEDEVTGPLYKTVYTHKTDSTFSVSKINEIVSIFFTVVWALLLAKYVGDKITLKGNWKTIAWVEISSSIGVIVCIYQMYWGYGRGRFSKTTFNFKMRNVFVDEGSTNL